MYIFFLSFNHITYKTTHNNITCFESYNNKNKLKGTKDYTVVPFVIVFTWVFTRYLFSKTRELLHMKKCYNL